MASSRLVLLIALVASVVFCTLPACHAQLVIPANSLVSFNTSQVTNGVILSGNATLYVQGTLTVTGAISGAGTINVDVLNGVGITSIDSTVNIVANSSATFNSINAGAVSAPEITAAGVGGTARLTYSMRANITGAFAGTAQLIATTAGTSAVFGDAVTSSGLIQGSSVSISKGVSGGARVQATNLTVGTVIAGSPVFSVGTIDIADATVLSGSPIFSATSSVTLRGTINNNITVVAPLLSIPNNLVANAGSVLTARQAARTVISGAIAGSSMLLFNTLDGTAISSLSSNITIDASNNVTLSSISSGSVRAGTTINSSSVSGSAIVAAVGGLNVDSVSGSAVVTANDINVTGAVSGTPTLRATQNLSFAGSVTGTPSIQSNLTIFNGSVSGAPTFPMAGNVKFQGRSAALPAVLSLEEPLNWSSSNVELATNSRIDYYINTNVAHPLTVATATLTGGELRVIATRALNSVECLQVLNPTARPVTTFFAGLAPYSSAFSSASGNLYVSYSGGANGMSVQLSGPKLFTATTPVIRIPEGSIDKTHTEFVGVVATFNYCQDSRLQINTILDWGTERQIQNNIAIPQLSGRHIFAGDLANGPSVSYYYVTAFASLNSGALTQNQVFNGSVIVDNVAPVLNVSAVTTATGVSGSPFQIVLSNLVDPGNDFVSAYTVHWGDNLLTSITCNATCVFPVTVSHVYAAASVGRNYLITVDLLDNDGFFGSVASLVTTQLAYLAVGPTSNATPIPTTSVGFPVPTSPNVNSTPIPPNTAPTTATSVGTSITINGNPLVYTTLGSFSEFVSVATAKADVTIPTLAGRTVQFVGQNVRCGSSESASVSSTQPVRLQSKTGNGTFNFSQIPGGQTLKLCTLQTDSQWAHFSDVALQTVAVTSVRYNAAVAAAATTTAANSKREILRSVLIPRQKAVTGISLRTMPAMQVGDSFAFATSATECTNGPSETATDITTVGVSTLDFSQIPSRTILSPCVRKAGYNSWLFFPNQVVGVVEPDTVPILSVDSSVSAASTLVAQQLMLLLLCIMATMMVLGGQL
jgi:hypothetical protein